MLTFSLILCVHLCVQVKVLFQKSPFLYRENDSVSIMNGIDEGNSDHCWRTGSPENLRQLTSYTEMHIKKIPDSKTLSHGHNNNTSSADVSSWRYAGDQRPPVLLIVEYLCFSVCVGLLSRRVVLFFLPDDWFKNIQVPPRPTIMLVPHLK